MVFIQQICKLLLERRLLYGGLSGSLWHEREHQQLCPRATAHPASLRLLPICAFTTRSELFS
jgi:hypothetical protein